MCRHACIWPLLLVLATASYGWSASPQPPKFHPIMSRYVPAHARRGEPAAVPGAGPSPAVGLGAADRLPRFFVSWVNVARELGAVLTLKSEIGCTTWSQIKLCFLYPPGDPRRPECCDGYPPKDPIEPPGQ
jgi:hypothetical protein